MLQNNPNFTETVGTVKEQTSQFNGMADTKVYNDTEKNNLSNARPTDPIQDGIYTLPDRKLIFQDLNSAFGGSTGDAPKAEKPAESEGEQ